MRNECLVCVSNSIFSILDEVFNSLVLTLLYLFVSDWSLASLIVAQVSDWSLALNLLICSFNTVLQSSSLKKTYNGFEMMELGIDTSTLKR